MSFSWMNYIYYIYSWYSVFKCINILNVHDDHPLWYIKNEIKVPDLKSFSAYF